jgi:hypothetical protein
MKRTVPALPLASGEYSQDSEQKFRRDLGFHVFASEQRIDAIENIKSPTSVKSNIRMDALTFRASIQSFP